MQTFNIATHTVILLVGPSQSGKSTFARTLKDKITNQDKNLRVSILSSDETRRELLGQELDRYDPKMMEASEAAFDLLFQRFEALTRFPINNEFIIIDTTGLDPDFRFKISDHARKNHYKVGVVLFDFATQAYFEGLDAKSKSIVAKHVESFKQRVLPGIKRKSFDYHFSVKSKTPAYFEDLDVQIVDHALWKRCNFFEPTGKPIAIIGDVHESVQALDELIKKLPQDAQLVFLGDLFDKGNQTKAMLEYLEKLQIQREVIFVVGNHESFVARRLRNQIEAISNENENFGSLAVFQQDPELATRFLFIFDQMLPYAIFKNFEKTICVTHSPCHNSAIGKLGEKVQKIQRNFYFASREHSAMIEELRFIEKEAKSSHPWHIFGHVAHAMKNMEMKNKVWLDSGAAYGRALSAFVVFPGGQHKIVSQTSEKLFEGKLLIWKKAEKETIPVLEPVATFSKPKENNLSVSAQLVQKYKLEPEDIYWLKTFEQSGAKFIAGTMSPARSTQTQLEPIEQALLYFKNKDVGEVILQPKWMGSRMQIYLHKNGVEDFAVTRSGSKAGNMHLLKPIMQQLHDKFDSLIDYHEELILDGEFLPWSAIGKELIEKEFLQYGKSVEQELNLLKADSVFQKFNLFPDMDSQGKGIETFMKQVEIYGRDMSPSYEPFSVLSVDGKIWTQKNQADIYQMLSGKDFLVLDLTSDGCLQKAREFFTQMTSKDIPYEGIVMKPLVFKEGVAPYMKVRNENYLHIIYGHDYMSHYQDMCKNKRIGKKLDLSIKQFELGVKMLQATTVDERLELACQMKFEINQEHELDPRL